MFFYNSMCILQFHPLRKERQKLSLRFMRTCLVTSYPELNTPFHSTRPLQTKAMDIIPALEYSSPPSLVITFLLGPYA